MNSYLIISILFGSIFFVGVLTLFFEDFFKKIKSYVTTLGVSFVLSLICVHVLPELFSSEAKNLGLYLLIGFVIQIVLELFSRGIEHGHVHGDEHHHHSHEHNMVITPKILYTLFFGLCVHAFIEGIPLFILEDTHAHHHHAHEHVHLTQNNFEQVFFWAIVSHKIPVAIVLMLFFISAKVNKGVILVLFAIFAFMTPLGGLIGQYINNNAWFDSLSTNLLAVTTGMLLHISTSLIFEEYHEKKDKAKNLLLIIGGLLLGIVLFQ